MIRILAAVLSLTVAVPALAATPQQERMKDCNKQATGMKGAERKAFMSKCLKGETAKPEEKGAAEAKPADTGAAAAPAAEAKPADAKADQKTKMKDCNQKATGMKGAERKKFMKECLSAK